jgi:hypothetical protein
MESSRRIHRHHKTQYADQGRTQSFPSHRANPLNSKDQTPDRPSFSACKPIELSKSPLVHSSGYLPQNQPSIVTPGDFEIKQAAAAVSIAKSSEKTA